MEGSWNIVIVVAVLIEKLLILIIFSIQVV